MAAVLISSGAGIVPVFSLRGRPADSAVPAGCTICYGVHSSRFGPLFVATAGRDVYAVALVGEISRDLAPLSRAWPERRIREDRDATRWLASVVESDTLDNTSGIRLQLRGSAFQIAVWERLLHIPRGRTRAYAQIAAEIGRPAAVRAVGNAVGANPVAILVPCHRVLRSDGAIGGYRWGVARKRAVLAAEGIDV